MKKEIKIIWPEIEPEVLANAIVLAIADKLAEYSPADQLKMYRELIDSAKAKGGQGNEKRVEGDI